MKLKLHHLNLSTKNVAEMNEFYKNILLLDTETNDLPVLERRKGYSGEVDQNDIISNPYYEKGEMIGKQGIESYYEDNLKGVKGKRYFQKDRFNRIIGPYDDSKQDISPKKADNLTLTIDIKLQEYAESLLKNKKGGIVAIEPSSGEILTLVSAPTYQSNQFIGQDRGANFQKLLKDTINKPLFDRALQAQYSPGSPMKILNALIGLQEGVIDEKTTFTCNAGHYYARNAFMACHNELGTISNLRKGIYNSCNTYFAKTYKRIIDKYGSPSLGLDSWSKHIKSFGLGDYLGYDLSIGKKGFIRNLRLINRSEKKILVIGSEILTGNKLKQDRVIDESVIVSENTYATLRVSCCEKNRWSPSVSEDISLSETSLSILTIFLKLFSNFLSISVEIFSNKWICFKV